MLQVIVTENGCPHKEVQETVNELQSSGYEVHEVNTQQSKKYPYPYVSYVYYHSTPTQDEW